MYRLLSAQGCVSYSPLSLVMGSTKVVFDGKQEVACDESDDFPGFNTYVIL